MAPLLEEVVPYLLKQLDAGRGRYLIGLAGLPGSGKSTLTAQLAGEVNARTAPGTLLALSMDGFHLTKAQLRQRPDSEAAFARRGAPWTFDAEALAARLQRLRVDEAEAVEWPDFQHEIGDPVEAAHLVSPTTRLILVEGLYLLHQSDGWAAVSASFDELWYLDTPFELAMERLARRHMSAWGLSRDEAQARIAANDGLNAEIVQQSREHADWRLAA